MRWAIVILAFVTAALVLSNAAATPQIFQGGAQRWIGVPAAMSALLAYGAAGYFGIPVLRRGGVVLAIAAPAGLAAGGVYAAEIALEYAFRPTDNSAWGLIEFGAVFALMALTGAVLAWRTGRMRPALAGGLWTGLIAALIWYAALLCMTELFRGTAAQTAVFRAEGEFEDFTRSGVTDFDLFVMQDYLGAGFYHLLLSPLIGVLMGSVGGGAALVARRLSSGVRGV